MSIDIRPGRYDIDLVHSSIEFSTRFVAARVRGTFGAFSGVVEVGDDLRKSTVTATIDVASLTTGVAARDEHLRSADFFDAAGHPQATFTSTGLDADGDRYTLHGDLTIRGTTLPVHLDVYFTGDGEDHLGSFRLGFRASTRVSRSAFGVDGNVSAPGGPLLIGDATDLTLEIQALVPGEADD
ncbi:MAG: YceI family protein [Nocardioidaceae bacterium]|nr:YceI family protein [Nocardioidaceae bacterium]